MISLAIMLYAAAQNSTVSIQQGICESYCTPQDACGWTRDYSCPWAPSPGAKGRAGDDGSTGYECCCVYRTTEAQPCGGNGTGPPAPPSPPPSPGSLCSVLQNINCYGDDLKDGGSVHSTAQCCELCQKEPGCNAWTLDHGNCWLKSDCSGKVAFNGVESGFVPGPAPPPPAPPFPPAPPVQKGLQRGVSLGGWLLMETSWMYDQFNTPAENDFIRITREKVI